ncbi:MAG: hypothetical protein ACQES9_12900 [Myxococcota bacterium]
MRFRFFILSFVFFNLGGCSTNGENLAEYKPEYGHKNLTFGRMRQSLTLVLYALEGGEMVDRAGLNMIAQATSIFYGYKYKEDDKNEEKFLRTFCSRNKLPTTTHKCLRAIVEHMLEESKKLTELFADDVSFKEHIKEIKTNLFQLIRHHLNQDNSFPFPLIELKEERVELAKSEKAKSKYIKRLPPGIEITVKNKLIISGAILRNKLEEVDKIKPLLMKVGNLKPPRILSLFIAKSVKIKKLLPLFKLMISADIDHFILWGKSNNLAAGFKVDLLAGTNKESQQEGVLLQKFNNWQEASRILAKTYLEGNTPRLVIIPNPEAKKKQKPSEGLFKPAEIFSDEPIQKLQPNRKLQPK